MAPELMVISRLDFSSFAIWEYDLVDFFVTALMIYDFDLGDSIFGRPILLEVSVVPVWLYFFMVLETHDWETHRPSEKIIQGKKIKIQAINF